MKRILTLVILLVALFPVHAFAQIAFDTALDGGHNSGASNSLTWNHTSTGANRIGIVFCFGDNITGGVDDLSGTKTWGGSNLTLVAKYTAPDYSLNRFWYAYSIIGQATGSQAIVITAATTHYLGCSSLSYTGAAQSGNPVESILDSHTYGLSDFTSSITTTVDNSWVVLGSEASSILGAQTGGTGSTFRTESATYHNYATFDSNGPVTPAGSYSMTVNYPGYANTGILNIMLSIKPATGGGGGGRTDSILLLNVGRK